MEAGARTVFNLCFVKVIMRDYRFESMPEISRLKRRALRFINAIFFGCWWGCGLAPRMLYNFSFSDTSKETVCSFPLESSANIFLDQLRPDGSFYLLQHALK